MRCLELRQQAPVAGEGVQVLTREKERRNREQGPRINVVGLEKRELAMSGAIGATRNRTDLFLKYRKQARSAARPFVAAYEDVEDG